MFKFYSNQFVFVYPKVDLLLHSFVCFLEVYLHSVLSITLPAPEFAKLIIIGFAMRRGPKTRRGCDEFHNPFHQTRRKRDESQYKLFSLFGRG